MPLDPDPSDETLWLYRQLPDNALMLLRTAYELDRQQPHLTAAAIRFIDGRLKVIQAEVNWRARYILKDDHET
jgi:hypothetical protein